MVTLEEIETAVLQLSPAEKQLLLLRLAQTLRAEGTLPEPRRFGAAEIEGWIEEDDADMEVFRRKA